MMKVLPTNYHVVVAVILGSILCCGIVSNGFTATTTRLTTGRSLQHQQPYHGCNTVNTIRGRTSRSSNAQSSSSLLLLTALHSSKKNTNLPKSRLLRSNSNPITFKRPKRSTIPTTNPISEKNTVEKNQNKKIDDNSNENDDRDNYNDEKEEEEFIEFAMDDDDDNDNVDSNHYNYNDDTVPLSPLSSSSSSSSSSSTSNEAPVMEPKPSTLTNNKQQSSMAMSTHINNNNNNNNNHDDSTHNTNRKVKVQYCALEPGTVIQIEVGDISRARKAWKKRRRSDSPLLIPCSILSVNRRSAIRYNCLYLLEKFGTSATATAMSSPNHNNNMGLCISLTELSIRYRTHLKSSLLYHATRLGYSNSYELITNIFHPSVQDAYGVQLVTTPTNNKERDESTNQDDTVVTQQQLYLQTPLSRTRAHSRAANAAILQFTDNDETSDALDHTGLVRIKKQPARQQQQQQQGELDLSLEDTIRHPQAGEQSNVETSKNTNLYSLVPLSVALRVSSEDVLENLVFTGSRHAAVVFDYDVTGDANVLPLITLSLNPQRNQVRDRYKQKNSNNQNKSIRRSTNKKESSSIATMKWFHELKVGDGPYPGTIVRLIKGGAIVNCNVFRHRRNPPPQPTTPVESSNVNMNHDGSIPVFGVLRFKDAVLGESTTSTVFDTDEVSNATDDDEDDEEEEEDSDWNNIFSIDELNSFDDDDDLVNENDDTTLEEYEDDDNDDEEDDDGEVLAAFNLENDDEFTEGEDITHLFNIKEDGTLEYTDPSTGITQVVSDVNIQDQHDDDDEIGEEDDDLGDQEYDDDEIDEENDDNLDGQEYDDDEDEDGPVLLSTFERTRGRTRKSFTELSLPKYRTQTLHVGDTVDIYMKSISKQSNQLYLSMDASIQGKKAIDMKKETDVNKKLNRLIKQLGGYQRLRELNGAICNGTIKATSNTGGGWYYVQPDIDNLPVGVATTTASLGTNGENGDNTNEVTWNVGDIVQVQLNGVDPDRGQLAMNIIGSGDSV